MIRKAEKSDIAAVAESYRELFAYETLHGSTTNWSEGIYPTKGSAEHALDANDLYVLKNEGVLCGSMMLNQLQPVEYENIGWKYSAKNDQVLVIHTLCVCPSQAGRGCGKQMVAFALEEAQRRSCKAVRLDTWAENHPAAALYEKMGFRLAGTAPMLLQGAIREQQIFFEREVETE